MKSNIKFLDEGIVRTPFFSLAKYLKIPHVPNKINEFCTDLYENAYFNEAVFLASPTLHRLWKSHIVNEVTLNEDKLAALNKSIIKYYIRMCTRSTPFGLFSSYSHFQLHPKTNKFSIAYQQQSLCRLISLDLHFLYNLVNSLNKRENIREVVRYRLNNSLYKVGNSYRYVEVDYVNKVRSHRTSSIQSDEIIELLFSHLKSSFLKRNELTNILLDSIEDVMEDEVKGYLDSMIEAQVLVGDFNIALNQSNPLKQLLSFLDKNADAVLSDEFTFEVFKTTKKLYSSIEQLKEEKDLDYVEEYKNMMSLANNLDIQYDEQYFINLNLKRGVHDNIYRADDEDLKLLREAIYRLSFYYDETVDTNSRLAEFKNEFYKKYEEQEVPLLVALDNEIGIDYRGIDQHAKAFSPLIDDLPWNMDNGVAQDIKINKTLHDFWNSIILRATSNKDEYVDIADLDSPFTESSFDKISKTFSVMFTKSRDMLVVKSIGGKALNMIGRFTNVDGDLRDLVKRITTLEKEENKDVLFAELVHLPNDRTANIIAREINRDIEIPYLSKESTNCKSLFLDDIFVSLKQNKFVLRSRKFNKEIKIYNSNAHNYGYNSLPVYEFLCDLQYDGQIRGLGVNVGAINSKAFRFFPRIVYKKRIVLSPATWKFYISDFKKIDSDGAFEVNYEQFLSKAKSNKIPRYIYLSEGDNNLLIDLKNAYLTQYILDELNKGKEVLLIESIENINEDSDYYSNEYIIPFVNNAARMEMKLLDWEKSNVQRIFPPGDEWIYYKIYTGIKTADKLLSDIVSVLIEKIQSENLCEKWFFLRFNDPKFHIRLRIKSNQQIQGCFEKITHMVTRFLRPYQIDHLISDLEMTTYKRELERYGPKTIDLAESIFYYDSEMVLGLTSLFRKNRDEDKRDLYCIKAIHGYFVAFNMILEERLITVKNLSESFLKEFNADGAMKKQLGIKFRSMKDGIKDCLESNSVEYDSIIEKRNERVTELLGSLSDEHKEAIRFRLPSYIHMTVNRMIPASPRMHELVLYSYLEKYYRILYYQEKQERSVQTS